MYSGDGGGGGCKGNKKYCKYIGIFFIVNERIKGKRFKTIIKEK